MNSGTVHTGRDGMVKNARAWVAGAGVLGCASVAYGNAGSVFASGVIMHLLIGNILLGAAEGFVIRKWFHSPANRTGLLMIAANFASWLTGVLALGWVYMFISGLFPEPTITSTWAALGITILAAWILTVVVEWPFCHLAVRSAGISLRHSFVVSAVVQTVSTGVLVALYLSLGNLSLIRELHDAAPEAALGGAPACSIYAIDPTTGETVEHRWDGTSLTTTVIAPPGDSPGTRTELLTGASLRDGAHRLVWIEDPCDEHRYGPEIAPGYGGAVWSASARAPMGPLSSVDRWAWYRSWQDLRAGASPAWYPRLYLTGSVRIINENGTVRSLGYRSNFEDWNFRDAIVLSDQTLILTVSGDGARGIPRIVAINLDTDRFAVIGRGVRPYVELDGAPPPPLP